MRAAAVAAAAFVTHNVAEAILLRAASARADPCAGVELRLANGTNLTLKHRDAPVRVVDFFQFCNEHELPELHLRLAEMGDYVDEIHVAEADRTFTGVPKAIGFPAILQNDTYLARWRHKITHHPVKILASVPPGYKIQDMAIRQKDKISKVGGGVLIEGDLDEITSRPVLRALKHCVPESINGWDAHIEMENYVYNMGWTTGRWEWPPLVHDLSGQAKSPSKMLAPWDTYKAKVGEFLEEGLSTAYVKQLPDGVTAKAGPSGWHLSLMLDGAEGLAYKLLRTENGKVNWVKEYESKGEKSLVRFLRDDFLLHPDKYEKHLNASHLEPKDLPEAMVEDPDRFRQLLGSVRVK